MASKIDGTDFPKEPLVVKWNKSPLGIRGDRRPFHSGYQDVELVMPFLTTGEYDFFYDKWETDTFHTVVMTAPDNQAEVTYTGTVINSVEGEEFDVPGFYRNVRIVLNIAR